MWPNPQETFFMQCAKCRGPGHCGSGGMFLSSYGILQDHVIKGSWDFMVGDPQGKVNTLSSLVTISTGVVEI